MSRDEQVLVAATDARTPVLSEQQRDTVRRIVAKTAAGARVFVFGSRATGGSRPFSDLDLLFEGGPALTLQERAAMRDAFEASDLPFRVDIVTADDLAEGFRQHVLRERVPI